MMEDNSPLVSIIIPIYNAEDTIRVCVESILSQANVRLELILVDDGSTDSSYNICDEYAKKDTRIIVVHQCNSGVSEARNKGIDLSKGEYITFVDSDDELLPGFFENAWLVNDHFDIYIGGYFRCDYSGANFNNIPNVKQFLINQLNEEELLNLFEKNYISPCWGKIYSRKLIGTTRFNKEMKFGEDLEFNLNLLANNPFVIASDKCLYKYNATDHSLTSLTDKNKCNNVIRTYCSLYSYGYQNGFVNNGKYFSYVDERWNKDLITIENLILKDQSSWLSKYIRIRTLCSNKMLIKRLKKKTNNYTTKYAIKPLKLIICYVIGGKRRHNNDT